MIDRFSNFEKFISERLDVYRKDRLEKLKKLKIQEVLKRKNPYLFRAKNILTFQELVESIMSAHLSSQEETMFGNLLEQVAIYVAEKFLGGKKSGIKGIDLEYEKNGTRHIVAIKSGPNWGNSSQIEKMRQDFIQAKKSLRTSGAKVTIKAINGCCYGRDTSDKGDYIKLCGQAFWQELTSKPEFYKKLIIPFGQDAKQETETFHIEKSKIINRFTSEISHQFSHPDGAIDWDRLLQYVSGHDS
ncbi:MAG: cytosolic protein [Alphaproteobacteria bacterium GM202ARS2]|nr:cytosolic protein [Alphaproteobacteria bacterium GM202ARS2]